MLHTYQKNVLPDVWRYLAEEFPLLLSQFLTFGFTFDNEGEL